MYYIYIYIYNLFGKKPNKIRNEVTNCTAAVKLVQSENTENFLIKKI